ncbi:hypothetical protein B0H17DRAFT_1150941 [Mycena rosella]|uniref:Uncharacterized protein n=1 Tax=Mycena rosella TaxID=1033263 RepID=A0AAD7BPL8_MYCRO|nr:hypothetical protein B0H17DRAFT_1150941 [Mycena rosella]
MAGRPHDDHIKTPAAPPVADCGVRKYTETVNFSVVGRVDRRRTFEGTTGLPRHWRVAFGMKERKPPLARHRIPIFRGNHRGDLIISIGNLPSKSLSEPQRTGSVVNLGGKVADWMGATTHMPLQNTAANAGMNSAQLREGFESKGDLRTLEEGGGDVGEQLNRSPRIQEFTLNIFLHQETLDITY